MVVAALAIPSDHILVMGLTMVQIMEISIAAQEEQMLFHGCLIKLGHLWGKCNPLEKGSMLPTDPRDAAAVKNLTPKGPPPPESYH
eukprot:2048685-Karenia_brevis.AAC.1